MEIKYRVEGKDFPDWKSAFDHQQDLKKDRPNDTINIERGVKYTHANDFQWVVR